MTSKIVTRMEFTAAPFASIRHAVVNLAMGVWRLIVAIKHRRELAHLADLDDRMLADIGLTRTDLRDACSEMLWRDPTRMLARRAGGRPQPLAYRRRGPELLLAPRISDAMRTLLRPAHPGVQRKGGRD